MNNPPHAADDNIAVHRRPDLGGDRALLENDSDPDHDSFGGVPVSQAVAWGHSSTTSIMEPQT